MPESEQTELVGARKFPVSPNLIVSQVRQSRGSTNDLPQVREVGFSRDDLADN
jgi:hypothetical protein